MIIDLEMIWIVLNLYSISGVNSFTCLEFDFLMQRDYFFVPIQSSYLSLKNAIESIETDQCSEVKALVDLISMSAELSGRSYNEIPSIKDLSLKYANFVSYHQNTDIMQIFESGWGLALTSAMRKAAGILRPVLGRREDVSFGCAVVHRHMSSTRATIEEFPGELSRLNVLLPVGEKLRDLAISGKRCGVESAVSLLGLARGVMQVLKGIDERFTNDSEMKRKVLGPILGLVKDLIGGINPIRLVAMSSPLMDILYSFVEITESRNFSSPSVILSPRDGTSKALIFGFDCGPEDLKFLKSVISITRRKDEKECKVLSPTDYDTKFGDSLSELKAFKLSKKCEAATVIESLIHLIDTDEWPDLSRKYSNEWLYLQSINSNWHEHLVKGWGEATAAVLSILEEKAKKSNLKPKRNPAHCNTQETLDFTNWVSSTYLKNENVKLIEAAEFLTKAVSFLISVNPDCSVELAIAYAVSIEIFADLLSRETVNESFKHKVAAQDLSSVIETIWQTIAGEKLYDVISNKLPLFRVMQRYWARLSN